MRTKKVVKPVKSKRTKRTKIVKSKRSKKVVKSKRSKRRKMKKITPMIYQNMGGYMINPPHECERMKIDATSNLLWTDLSFCSDRYCPRVSSCERRKEFKNMTMDERHEELRSFGVKI